MPRVTTITPLERDTGQGTPPLKRVTARVGVRGDVRPRTLVIDAPLVVVAAGAIETPALLQRSGMGGGGVGEWLRLHPTTAITGVYPNDILSNTGIPLSSMCDEFIRWNNSDYGFWIETPPMHPSFMAAALPAFGTSHAARMRHFRQLGVLIALTRDGADHAHLQRPGPRGSSRADLYSVSTAVGRSGTRPCVSCGLPRAYIGPQAPPPSKRCTASRSARRLIKRSRRWRPHP